MASNPHLKADQAHRTELRIKAYSLALQGNSYRKIGTALGISQGFAHTLVMEEIESKVAEPREALRTKMLDQTNEAIAVCNDILGKTHYVVNHGKVIKDDNGEPLVDHEVYLKTLDRLNRLFERQAKLLGLDKPIQIEQTTQAISPVDASIIALVEQQNAQAEAEAAKINTPTE